MRILQPCLVDVNGLNSSSGFLRHSLLALMAAKFDQEVLPDDVARVSEDSCAHTTQVFSVVLFI